MVGAIPRSHEVTGNPHPLFALPRRPQPLHEPLTPPISPVPAYSSSAARCFAKLNKNTRPRRTWGSPSCRSRAMIPGG